MIDILNPLIQKWLGTIVRTGLTALGTYLISHGWASTAQWTDAAMAVTPILVSILWSAYEKVQAMAATEVAKTLPSGATKAVIHETLADTSFGQKVQLAANPK